MKPLHKIIQYQAYRLVFFQLGGVLVLALIALIWQGRLSGFSVLLGGMAYGLPNLIFVWRVFRFARVQQFMRFMAAFFIGETIKLISSAILFLCVVKYLSVSLLSSLIGFIGAIVIFWIVCLRFFPQSVIPRQKIIRSELNE